MAKAKANTAKKRSRKPSAKAGKGQRDRIDPELNELAEKRLGSRVAQLEFPGGRSRASCRVILKNGRRIIASKRKTASRAKLEITALSVLGEAGMPVPELLASNGRLYLQQDVGNSRLTDHLYASESEDQRFELLDNALAGLNRIHESASEADLERQVPLLGSEPAWLEEFAARPKAIGGFFKITAPKVDTKAVANLLAVRKPRFIKWDARPGNAMVIDNADVVWIDWEHCGARNRLDDFAWVMADEYVDDSPALEQRLLVAHLENYADGLTVDAARDYLMTYGTLHACVRLGLMLDRKGNGDWWDEEYCVAGDKIGITLAMADRQCRRALRWSSESTLLAGHEQLFNDVREKLAAL